MIFVFKFIGNVFLSFSEVYAWFNLSRTKFPKYDKSIYFKVLLLSIFTLINHYYGNNFIRGLLIMMISILFCKLILKLNIRQTIILSFIGQLIIIIIEAFLVGIMSLIFRYNLNFIMSNMILSTMFDIVLSILIFIISKSKFLSKQYNQLVRITGNISLNQILAFIIFITLGSSIFCTSVYFQNNLIITLILNMLITLFYTLIVLFALNYQNKYYKINSKYNMSLEDLQAQENLISNYRIMNHENRNNLLTIKEMTKNKKVQNYITSLVKNNKYINKDIIIETYNLPSGGIRAVVYNKMNVMKNKNIKAYLNVDKKITLKRIENLTDDDIVDICQILGVFLDNAIEETLNFKEKEININFSYIRNNLNILISNYCDSINKFSNLKIKSTKGKNRGYGLQLVRKIVENNNKIIHNTIISKNTFSQELIIKL